MSATRDIAHAYLAAPRWNKVWDHVWTEPWETLSRLELIPGHRFSDNVWQIPTSWASGGHQQMAGARTIAFVKAIPQGWKADEPRSIAAIQRLKRVASLMLTRTLRVGGMIMQPPQPSTWVAHTKHLLSAARVALIVTSDDRALQSDEPIFARLTPEQMAAVREQSGNFAHVVLHRMNGLLAARAFDDWPATDVASKKASSQPIQPLPDEATAALGAAALWIAEVLGPDLLTCWQEARQIRETNRGRRRSGDVRTDRKAFVANWQGETLKTGLKLRYPMMVRETDDLGVSRSVLCQTWPPRNIDGVGDMVYLLQAAHAIILTLCSAAREGESLDLERDCLKTRADQDLLEGPTYKLSDSPVGEERHWPLPKIAVRAIIQQRRLATIMAPDGHRLFVGFDARSDGRVASITYLLTAFARRIVLPDGRQLSSLYDGGVNSTRMRKTVVRLAALSLVGANQILVDILGHRDPEMTLGYIVSDPKIQDEMRTIAQEAAIATAKEAITGADGNGGLAAPAVRELAQRLAPRTAPGELEAQRISQAADILSMNGSAMLVRKNVLCTKALNQYGPCTRRAGAPDAGSCQPDCINRLELAAARSDHRAAIAQILHEMPPEGTFMRSWWQAQLVAHLTPFPDLRTELLADSRGTAALAGISHRQLATLGLLAVTAGTIR